MKNRLMVITVCLALTRLPSRKLRRKRLKPKLTRLRTSLEGWSFRASPRSEKGGAGGDPGKEGFYTQRFQVSGWIQNRPSYPSTNGARHVISGTFNIGMGEKFDPSAGQAIPAGAIFSCPLE